ncbi:hypothetical protein PSH62_17090 [Pseudomonas tolaasii]|nr:hypothetical protein [Pseudomonas tolaasii]WLH49809.1 hypothetical protein PSH62_17090 [Pseudomonas tolaasii]
MSHENEELFAVHAQGPDDLYAAASREEAEQLAAQQNELVPAAKCIVIRSPWRPLDHWKTLAEQNAVDAKTMRLGWQADLDRLNAARAEITALSKNVIEFTREDFDATLNNLRRMGASIDGDNAYKRDLCDSIVGALAFGAQNTNPPPTDHWGQRFWDIGREERASAEQLLKALMAITQVAGECEQIASNYSGTIDGIFEHGGDDHEDPSCAIFHRLYYAMFDARAAIKKATI